MNNAPQKVVAIIQARLGSTRLPLKSLLCLDGLPIIDWVTRRVAKSRLIDEIIVAVPDTDLDRALLGHLGREGINCMAGPENDVLRRFTLAARQTGADLVVRICADNPLVWGKAIDRLIEFYRASHCDYAWNHIPRDNMWPDGLGAEIVSAELLERIDGRATLPSQREHCFNYIWDNAQDFAMATFDPHEPELQRPDVRLDIDCAQDFCKLACLDISPEMDGPAIIRAWDRHRETSCR